MSVQPVTPSPSFSLAPRVPSPAALAAVTAWFEGNFDSRGDLGASVSIWQNGVEILSLSQGYCDRNRLKKWSGETLVPVWSATKGCAAVCALQALHAKGLPLESPVAEVWPEFAGGGKKRVTFAQLFSHRAGLCALDARVPITDYAGVIGALESQAPLWEPGARQGYHARTFGFLMDEVVRRITGAESLGSYFQQHFGAPLGLDFWIGLPSAHWERVSAVYPGKITAKTNQEFLKAFNAPGSMTQRAFASPEGLNAVSDFNRPETWAGGYASMGGVGSAHGLAKFYAMLAQGGKWHGVQIVPEQMVRQLQHSLSQGMDAVLCTQIAFSAGAMKDPLDTGAESHGKKIRRHFGPSLTAFGHPGAGGSLAFADPENGISFAYVMNQMEVGALPNEKAIGLVEALYQ